MGQEELLNYDDAAAFYFCASVLACICIPWTWSRIKSYIYGNTAGLFPKVEKFKKVVYVNNTLTEEKLKRMEAFEQAKSKKNTKWNTFSLVTLSFLWILFF